MNEVSELPDQYLRVALSAVIAEVDPTLAGRSEHEPDSYLDLIGLAQRSSEEIMQLLQSAVTSTRLAGGAGNASGNDWE